MKLHLGCGQTIIPGFVNIDNSPSLRLAGLPSFALNMLRKMSVINEDQRGFIQKIKENRKEMRYADVLKLPYPDNSIDVIYSSHMIGWCFSRPQLDTFFSEMKRVLKPGGVIRVSCFDFDEHINEFLQHRDTERLSKVIPLASTDFGFKEKLKFLFSPNMHGGIVLNAHTLLSLLEQNGLVRIQRLQAGETTMTPEQTGQIDLSQRSENSVYVECYKPL